MFSNVWVLQWCGEHVAYMNNSLQSIRTDQCSSHAFLVVAQLEQVGSQQQWCYFAGGSLVEPSLAEDILVGSLQIPLAFWYIP